MKKIKELIGYVYCFIWNTFSRDPYYKKVMLSPSKFLFKKRTYLKRATSEEMKIEKFKILTFVRRNRFRYKDMGDRIEVLVPKYISTNIKPE